MTVINIEKIKRYLEAAEPVKGYVHAGEGLIIESKNIDDTRAEELAAWSYNILSQAGEKLGIGKPRLLLLEAEESDLVIAGTRDHTITAIIEPGYGKHVSEAFRQGSIKCGSCQGDLSTALVICPSCGSLNPFTAPKCSKCGRSLTYRRCPYCGSLLYNNGEPAGLRSRLFASREAARVQLIDSSPVEGRGP